MNGKAFVNTGIQERLRILIADNTATDVELELRALRDGGIVLDSLVVYTESTFRTALVEFQPHVILSDFVFADFDGVAAIQIAREMCPAVPLIFVSGTITEERAAIAVQNCAADYVLKTSLERLPKAVLRATEQVRERERRLEADRRMSRLSRTKDVLSSVNAAIVRLRDRTELFGEVCRIARDAGGFTCSLIVTVDDDRHVEVSGLCGEQPPVQEEAATFFERALQSRDKPAGVFARSMRTRRPAAIGEVGDRPELPRMHGVPVRDVHAVASVPLLLHGAAIGALILASQEPGFFDDEALELLAELASNLTFAMDLIEKQGRVDYLSYYDPLTELPNRMLFIERMRQALVSARYNGSMAAVMLLDIHRFAQLNASLGGSTGDELLREGARRLRALVGSENIARFSGDRFAAALPVLNDLQPVVDVLVEDGIRMFNEPFTVGDRELTVSVHAGCAVFPQDGDDVEVLCRNAEIALQDARRSGEPFRFFSGDLARELDERVDLEARLQSALADGQFQLYYQPKVDSVTRALTGLEALIRWRDPDRADNVISPSQFVPVLEQTGLIVSVGKWALNEAARQHAQWRRQGLAAPRIAVNLSARQLKHPHIVEHVKAAIGDGPCALDLEISESMLMENLADVSAKVWEIRALGAEIALDDFGTGYSSLASLHQLPISALKIDRSFIDGLTEDPAKTSIVSTIISLGHSLRLQVVAEGVESEEQAHLLQLLRCDQMQGYLVALPSPPEALAPIMSPA